MPRATKAAVAPFKTRARLRGGGHIAFHDVALPFYMVSLLVKSSGHYLLRGRTGPPADAMDGSFGHMVGFVVEPGCLLGHLAIPVLGASPGGTTT